MLLLINKSLEVSMAKMITVSAFFVSVLLKSGNQCMSALQLLPPVTVIKHVHVLVNIL